MTTESFEQQVFRIAHRKATKYRHDDKVPLHFSGAHMIDFARALAAEWFSEAELFAHKLPLTGGRTQLVYLDEPFDIRGCKVNYPLYRKPEGV